MSTADELLATVADSEPILVIDLETRTIAIPSSIENLGVESDDDVLRLYFRMPRYYGEFDLSEFEICINYVNAKGEPDLYEVDDAEITDEEINFSWLVGRFAAKYEGIVTFIVCLKKYASDGTTVKQEFNTTLASLNVLDGLETSEAIVQEYSDILAVWEQNLFGLRKNGVQSIEEATNTALTTVRNETAAQVANVQAAGQTAENALGQVKAIIAGNESYTKYESDIRYGVPIIGELSGDAGLLTATDSAEGAFRGFRIFGKSTQAITTGKNIINNITPLHAMNCTVTKIDDGYSAVTTSKSWVNIYFSAGEYTDYIGKTVTLQVKNTSNYEMLVRLGNVVDNSLPDGTEVQMGIAQPGGSSKLTVTIPESDNPSILGVRIIFNAASINIGTSLTFENLQLEYGSTATTYEPYSGGLVSPSLNWASDIKSVENPSFKVYGANLANLNNLTVNSNTSLHVSHDGYYVKVLGGGSKAYASSTTYLNANLLRGKDIVFKADRIDSHSSTAKAVVQLNIFTTNNKYYEPISTNSLSRVLSIPKDAYEITLGVYTNNNSTALGSDNTVIAEGIGVYLTDREWVPCNETRTVSLSYTLPGVPVSSGGNYTDSDGQQYICDEIDLHRGVYIQRIGHLDNILTDSTGQNEFDQSVTEGYKKYTVRRNLKGLVANVDHIAMGLCNRFKVKPISGNITNNTTNMNTCIAWSRSSGGFYIMVPETEYPDLESFIEAITLNPVEVYYVLETPVETALSAEAVSAYKGLRSNKPATTVFNDGTVFAMEAKYVVDTKTYIDNKFTELEAKLG